MQEKESVVSQGIHNTLGGYSCGNKKKKAVGFVREKNWHCLEKCILFREPTLFITSSLSSRGQPSRY